MYAIKQAMLISGSLPLADVTIYYMDMRAFGKGYEQFYQNAKAMGVEFVKGKVAKITEDEDQNPVVRVELIEDGLHRTARQPKPTARVSLSPERLEDRWILLIA
jgi:heterodisulfide reductase subunit A